MKTLAMFLFVAISMSSNAQDFSHIKIYQKDSLIESYTTNCTVQLDTVTHHITICENNETTVYGFGLKKIGPNRFRFEKKTHFLLTSFTEEIEVFTDKMILYTHFNYIDGHYKFKIIFQ